eukprot:COSAG02_NODE_380_length_23483_cov_8.034382_14_plen_81_part_00
MKQLKLQLVGQREQNHEAKEKADQAKARQTKRKIGASPQHMVENIQVPSTTAVTRSQAQQGQMGSGQPGMGRMMRPSRST